MSRSSDKKSFILLLKKEEKEEQRESIQPELFPLFVLANCASLGPEILNEISI